MADSRRAARFAASFALLLVSCSSPIDSVPLADWPVYGGDPGSMKFSGLTQIDRSNVAELEIAWSWTTGEETVPEPGIEIGYGAASPGRFQATPIVVNDTLFVSTPYSRVVALDATTGEELWSYDPRAYDWGQLPLYCGFCHRGVAMWSDGAERRIFINSRWRLIALDAATGQPIESFGRAGEVDVTEDLVWEVDRLDYMNTSPPVVWGNLVILGSGMPDRQVYTRNPPGDVQAFDVRTGERVWSFHTIPQAGEFGNETWEDESWSRTGSTNVWAPFSVDEARGLIYLPVGTPNGDYYGGHRKGSNLFAESIVCLDARTGERVWHYQTVHHGLWDYDLPTPPILASIEVGGRPIDAVAVLAKTGFTFVFDRVTGAPVWPIEERRVPGSVIPGERTALTQPFPSRPAPFARQGFTADDVVDFTPDLEARARAALEGLRLGPMFTPPSLEGTVQLPGPGGAVTWGGGAFDPTTHVLYVPGRNAPSVVRVEAAEPGTSDMDYVHRTAGIRVDGLPIVEPPYGTVTAIDLDRGEHLWQVAVGDDARIRDHPLLEGLSLPPLGRVGNAGPLATAGGLLFLSADNPSLYALDTEDGRLLWEGDLGGAQGTSNPMTYLTRDGRQLVVIGVTGPDGERGLTAFSMPDR